VIAAAARAALTKRLEGHVRFDVPMGRYTSLGVGGLVDALATPESQDEVAALVALCAEHDVPLTALGGGFNTLVLDGGLDGVVFRSNRLRALALDDDGLLDAETGVSHSQVTRLCVERAFHGLEFGAGIPGSIGGWVAMNAGVPEHEVGAHVVQIAVATPRDGLVVIPRAALRFVYRGVLGMPAGGVVVAARFQLEAGDRESIRASIDRHLAHRRATQPIDLPSCGSVFKNPPGEHAGRLIELAGMKGAHCGGAQISSVHANFIVNNGSATAADVTALIRRAQDTVRERSGIELVPEVRIIGRPG
jgi:UDP-N-acetylmuramate dehydrogenase